MKSKLKVGRKGDRKSDRKRALKGERKGELIEVFLMGPDGGRPPFTFEPGALEFLAPDAPLPGVGDVLLLPREVTGDTKAQTFAWGGRLAPFMVVEREHTYFRDGAEKFDRANPTAARYVRTMVLVRRLTQKEYSAGPGQSAASAEVAAES